MFDFIDGFSLDAFSDRRIADYVQGLVARKVEQDRRLASEVGRHWSEIVVGRSRVCARVRVCVCGSECE